MMLQGGVLVSTCCFCQPVNSLQLDIPCEQTCYYCQYHRDLDNDVSGKWISEYLTVLVVVVAFCSLARTFREGHSFPACTFFWIKWRSARAHQCYFLGQDQSTVAQQAKMTVAEHSLMSCMGACFLLGSHTMPGRVSQSTPTSLGQGCMCVQV